MSLHTTLPWTRSPLVINAPMGGFAGHALATAVSTAGGLGFIGAGLSLDELTAHLGSACSALPRHNDLLPLGVGLLCFINPLPALLPIIQRFKPAVIWLFAAKSLSDYTTWSTALREASPHSQIWIQVGSVSAAIQVAKSARPDVLCVQGIDAGGHGFEKGAGIISLLPEVADALASNGMKGVKLVAAGGIADGRGAAAALALGAEGVVLGTRFLAATETLVHPGYRAAVLAAKDGGQNTVRAKLFDELRGPNMWPGEYDGRSVVMQSWVDHAGGMGIEEIRKAHAEALGGEGAGFAVDGKGRAAMWAGTGVGLVKREQGAAEIVQEVRRGAVEALKRVQSVL